MTSLRCISCKGENLCKLHKYRTMTKAEAKFFRDGYLYQCAACQLIQLFPRPSEAQLVEFYQSSYRDENDADAWEQASRSELASGAHTGLVGLLRQYAPAPRIVLDVGAGVGNHSRSAQAAFPHAQMWCVEPGDVFSSRLRAAGLRTIKKPWPEAAQDFRHKADAVILSHVLEHVLNPPAFVETLVNVMAPGGWLALEVPNDPDFQVHAADHSPHISFFTQTSLRALLSKFGKVVFVDTAAPPILAGCCPRAYSDDPRDPRQAQVTVRSYCIEAGARSRGKQIRRRRAPSNSCHRENQFDLGQGRPLSKP